MPDLQLLVQPVGVCTVTDIEEAPTFFANAREWPNGSINDHLDRIPPKSRSAGSGLRLQPAASPERVLRCDHRILHIEDDRHKCGTKVCGELA